MLPLRLHEAAGRTVAGTRHTFPANLAKFQIAAALIAKKHGGLLSAVFAQI
jgi:hypothetical protein